MSLLDISPELETKIAAVRWDLVDNIENGRESVLEQEQLIRDTVHNAMPGLAELGRERGEQAVIAYIATLTIAIERGIL